jgi:hypothetical protein
MPKTVKWIDKRGIGARAPGSIEVVEDSLADVWCRRGLCEIVKGGKPAPPPVADVKKDVPSNKGLTSKDVMNKGAK